MADTYFDDGSPPALRQRDAGEVRIDEREIVVSYEDDDGVVIYRGNNDGSGHFSLEAPERNGRASLHRFIPNGNFLEGYWIEGGNRGMWRIELGQPDLG
ncbi:hypothetical protein HF285_04675 [Acidithiobacillus ferrooxidans F221]|nr:hypothetical protein [Acidithiobacillus ferrooxidans F221]